MTLEAFDPRELYVVLDRAGQGEVVEGGAPFWKALASGEQRADGWVRVVEGGVMRVVLCNCPPDHAERIARELVEKRVAACVNVVPGVVSVYRWKGELQRDQETTLLIKTSDERVPDLKEAIAELHPYEVPEIVVLPVADVNDSYAAWVVSETRG